MFWGCSRESGLQEDLLASNWPGHAPVPGNSTLLAARDGRGGAGSALRGAPSRGWMGTVGTRTLERVLPGVSAQAREGVEQKGRSEWRAGTKAPQWLGKGCLCSRLKAPGNNNQDLSLGNHHSNIKTQVGERDAPRGAPCISSRRCSAPSRGSRAWHEGKRGLEEAGALPAAIELNLRAARAEPGLPPCGTSPRSCSIPSQAAPGDTTGPCHLLCWVWKDENAAFPALVRLQTGTQLLPGTGTGTSTVLLPLGSSGTRSTRLAGTGSSPVSATRAAKPP